MYNSQKPCSSSALPAQTKLNVTSSMHQLLSYLRFAAAMGLLFIGGFFLASCGDSVTGPEPLEQLVEVTIEGVVVDATGDSALIEQQGVQGQTALEEGATGATESSTSDAATTDTVSAARTRADSDDQMPDRALATNSDPIEGATVSVYLPGIDEAEDTSTTAADGTYTLTFSVPEEEAPRTLDLVTEADGFDRYSSEIDFATAITYDVALEELAGYSIAGAVVNQYGAGVEDATIEFNGGERVTSTNANGRWSQSGFEGTVTVSVQKQDYAFETVQRTVDGPNEDIDFEGVLQIDPPEGGNAEIELAENAKIADEHTSSRLVSYEDGYLLFEDSTTFLENLEEGDVIALEPNGEIGEDEFLWKVTGEVTEDLQANLSHDGFSLPVDPAGWFDFLKPEPQELRFEFSLSAFEWGLDDSQGGLDIEQVSEEVRVTYDKLLFTNVEGGAELELEIVDGEVVFREPSLKAGVVIAPDGSWLEIGDFFLDANLDAEGFVEMKGKWSGDGATSVRFPIGLIIGGEAGAVKGVIEEALKQLLGEHGGWIGTKIVEFLGAISPLKADIFFDVELDGGAEFHDILQVETTQTATVDVQEEESDFNYDGTFAANVVCGSLSQGFEARAAAGLSLGFYLTKPEGDLRGAEIGYSQFAYEMSAEQEAGGGYSISYAMGPAFILKWSLPFERERWFGPFIEVGYTVEGGSVSYADLAFEQAVRTLIPVPEIDSRADRSEDACPLLPSDVEEIEALDASGLDVESISGLEAMTGLEVVDLSDNKLSAIEPLADLAEPRAALVEVDLRGNPSLNVAFGAEARAVIDQLESAGVTVYYDEPESTEATISGTVTDEETGEGIEAATVTGTDTATGSALFETTTDTFGDYETTFTVDEAPAEITIFASTDGYEETEQTVGFAEELQVNLTLDPSGPSGDAMIFTASSDEEVHALTSDGEEVWRFTGHSDPVRGVAVDADGYVYTGAAASSNQIRKLTSDGDEVWRYPRHNFGVVDVAVDADGHVYSASHDPSVHKITPEGNRLWRYRDSWGNEYFYGVAVDKAGYVYTGSSVSNSSSNRVRKLSSDGEDVWRYTGHSGVVADVAVDADGYVYTASWDREVHKLTPDGEEMWRYTGHSSAVNGVAIDSEGYIYTASSDGEVHKVMPGGEEVWRYTGHSNPVTAVAIDADGYVYTGSRNGELHKLTPQGQQVWRYTGHSDRVWGIAVSPGAFSVSQGLVD